MSKKKQMEQVRSLPVVRDDDWVMERRSINIEVEELGDIQPDVLVCVSPGNGVVIGATVVGPDASESETLSWAFSCMLSPMVGEPRRPSSVILSGGKLKHLQETLEQLGISVKATSFPSPVVDDVVSAIEQGVEGSAEPPYLMKGDVDPKVAEAFFAAAAGFYKVKPWKLFEFEVPMKVEIIGKNQAVYWVIVMGTGGEEFGLSLYRSPEDLMDILDAETDEEALMAAQSTWSFGFSYQEVEDIGEESEEELITNKWPVAGPSAYPSAIVMDPESQELAHRPNTDELKDMASVVFGLTDFFKANRQKIKDGEVISDDVRDADVAGEKLKAVISLPAPEFFGEDDEDEED